MKRHNNNYNEKRIGGSTLIEIIIIKSRDVERNNVKQDVRKQDLRRQEEPVRTVRRKGGDTRRKRPDILNVFCGIHARIVVLIPV